MLSRVRPRFLALFLAGICAAARSWGGAVDTSKTTFDRDIEPVLEDNCYDCHGDGESKGGVHLDAFTTDASLHDRKLWLRVFKNVRAGLMPPSSQPRLLPEEYHKLMTWIKFQAFELDPVHPDPGRVTLRRLNRVEYRNTVRALTGVDFDTQSQFPPDDTGQGFDNIAAVLTISPMLLEHYLDAAQAVIDQAVPTQPRAVAVLTIPGADFTAFAPPGAPMPAPADGALDLSYYTPSTVAAHFSAEHAGTYRLTASLMAVEHYVDNEFDLNRCRLVFKADGDTLVAQEFVRESDKPIQFTFERHWAAGDHTLTFEVQPVSPAQPHIRQLRIRVKSVSVAGPEARQFWVQPPNYERFFPRPVPSSPAARERYAAELLSRFASRAFRRPVDDDTVNRLVDLADSVAAQPGGTFEGGVAQAMVAVLASPRFIFRVEDVEPAAPGEVYPKVDEYALASRLSYFFWSSMPDDELFRLASENRLRANLQAQVTRMLADPRSREFIRNFTGQWLEARDIPTVQIDGLAVYLREHPNPAIEKAFAVFQRVSQVPDDQRTPEDKAAFALARKTFIGLIKSPKPQLTDSLREAMQRETEMNFAYVIRQDRPLTELLDCNYTFLNAELARHYGIPGVVGDQMRRVVLPPGSVRGGILTEGTVLAVTSNPTRTSPVKRGVFVLDAVLGMRPPPPPPNLPALEDAASPEVLRTLTLRENLKLHATNPSCAACHARMDPLGLALENFNAMGAWRTTEYNRTIDPHGQLITGEKFTDVRELKHILATSRRRDFYYCFTEKMMTYALGRTMDYYDVDTVDRLVAALEASGGRPSALLNGIVNTAAFQERRLAN
ncbi:MAG TPA: DUF1592 domain-containing protein [Opitutaceae bacterium]|jgi:hypothetical protein|nr:DUF1592 domain-containing protein [Opitutaceae bacterium]